MITFPTCLPGQKAMPTRVNMLSLLAAIVAEGDRCDASDTVDSPVAPYCSDKYEPDAFNKAISNGWVRVTHETSFDESWASITDEGRKALEGLS